MSKYSSEFKLQVVKYYLENNFGYQTTANHFGVAYSPGIRWVRKWICRTNEKIIIEEDLL